MKNLFYIISIALATDGVLTGMPILKAQLRRQPAQGKDAYEFSLEIETDMKANNTNEKQVLKSTHKETEPDYVNTRSDNKTYIKIGKSQIVITDTTDEVKVMKNELKKAMLRKKQKPKSVIKKAKQKKRRYKIVEAPDGTTIEDENELFDVKSNEDSPTERRLDKWVNEVEDGDETESATDSPEVKKKPKKTRPKRYNVIKPEPFKNLKFLTTKERRFNGYRSTKQIYYYDPKGTDLENETSRVLNVEFDAKGEPVNRIVIESHSYIPTQRNRAMNPGNADKIATDQTVVPYFLPGVGPEASIQSQINSVGMYMPSMPQIQQIGSGPMLYNPRKFEKLETPLTQTEKPTTEAFDFVNVLRRVAESQVLDNITNILLDKVYNKMSTKAPENMDDSVERFEILLEPDQDKEPKMQVLRKINFNSNKGFFMS